MQARERRPPGRHSPPQAGGREGPRAEFGGGSPLGPTPPWRVTPRPGNADLQVGTGRRGRAAGKDPEFGGGSPLGPTPPWRVTPRPGNADLQVGTGRRGRAAGKDPEFGGGSPLGPTPPWRVTPRRGNADLQVGTARRGRAAGKDPEFGGGSPLGSTPPSDLQVGTARRRRAAGKGSRVRGWFASRPHATVESDAQARERRPPGRHSPPRAGGREGPRVQGWFASRQGPRRSASSGRLRGTRLSRRFAQRCRPGGRRSLLCRRNRTPEHALTRRRGCPAPPNRMRPAPPETTTPTLPAPATILPGRRGVAQSGRAPGSGSGGRRFKSCRPDAARPHGRVPAPRRPRRPAVSDAFFPAPSHPGGGRAFRHSPMDQNVYIPALLPKTFVPVSALFLALAS